MGTDGGGIGMAPIPYPPPGEIRQVGFDLIGDTTEAVRELDVQRQELAHLSRKPEAFA